ncbi:MAG: flagellar biosynthetic protein FliQ [Proteobacteria bacterium]|nr:flagellar biosynthetic protein FliQ [Pseudomonadota bacterium]
MTVSVAIDWFREMLWMTVVAGSPAVLAAVIVGMLVAILQAATQISDSAVAFAPKALAAVVSLAVASPWIMSKLVAFATRVLTEMAHVHP